MMLIQFDDTSGRRIGNAVRFVEDQANRRKPLSYAPVLETRQPKEAFRVCTFTGVWSKNTSRTVTFRNQTSTPNTAVAINLFATVGDTATLTRNCAIARDGTAWYLIAAEC